MTEFGACVFGLVVGYITYRTLARTVTKSAIGDLAAVIAAIGGGTVTKLYDHTGAPFAWYALGLAIGMTTFFLLFLKMNGKQAVAHVMGITEHNLPPHSAGPQA